MSTQIVTGDDAAISITLLRDGATFTINPTAIVRAAVTNLDTDETSSPVTLSDSTPGADWANSLVVAVFPQSLTSTLTPGVSQVEIEVDDSGKTTWFLYDVVILQGNI